MSIRRCVLSCACALGLGCGGTAVAPSVDGAAPAFDAPPVAGLTDPATATPTPGEGVITLAGAAERGSDDGPGSRARFNNPTNVALGPDGNVYVADYDNGTVRVVRPSGDTLTFTRQKGFARPFGLAFAADGALYAQTDSSDLDATVNDAGMLWRLDRRTGVATPVARGLGRPRGIAALPDGRVVLVDNERHVVRLLDPRTREVTALAGASGTAGWVDGVGAAARFNHPYDVVLAPDGVLILADHGNNRLRAVTLAGAVSTWAGSGARGGADGVRETASFNGPQALAVDAAGDIFVADTGGYVVRRVAADGAVTTVAGVGRAGFADGPRERAEFFGLEGIDVSPDGATVYVADGNRGGAIPSHRLRRIALAADPL